MDNSQRVAQKEDQTVVAQSNAKKDATRTHQTRIPTDKTRFPWAAQMISKHGIYIESRDKETQQVPTDVPSSLQGHVRVPLQDMSLSKPASNKDNSSQILISTVDFTFNVVDDLASLAAVSALENMPIMVYVNETIDPPATESAPSQTMAYTNETIDYLATETTPTSKNNDSIDLLTPLGKRILRERPVKPSEKAKEWQLQSTARGRGNKGHGNRGRHR
ncbi:unnamed protein product [Eruca vesicaria subsp. sativa]|uniref:Uncharacterized protein n=1 Tax=Eruca vesicaria subsp. sativa TaxID=29727 RepID=A0ABC8J7M2_ERUVS|nr:unnamed protein product [Eruca vesicaria subsp. sativa]